MQGFVSIAEVDTKGRARRLPIRADIRRALCFPGGSTLMVSHLSKDISANFSDAVKKSFSLKPHEKSSSLDVQIQGLGDIGESLDTLKAPVQTSLKTFLPHVLVKDGFQKDDDMLDGKYPIICFGNLFFLSNNMPAVFLYQKLYSGKLKMIWNLSNLILFLISSESKFCLLVNFCEEKSHHLNIFYLIIIFF